MQRIHEQVLNQKQHVLSTSTSVLYGCCTLRDAVHKPSSEGVLPTSWDEVRRVAYIIHGNSQSSYCDNNAHERSKSASKPV